MEDADVALVREADEAERRQQMRDRGRQIGGVPGAVVAGLMIALRDIYDAKPERDDGVPMVEVPGRPHDVDREGFDLLAADIGGDGDVTIAAMERRAPILGTQRRRPRRRWLR